MNSSNNSQTTTLLDAVCRRGVLVATSVRYWRGCKKLSPEDLGLDPAHVSDRLIQLGHKRLIPRDALQAFALIESRVQATAESSSFPFLGGIGRFVPNPRLGDLTDKLDKLRDEFREATLDFVAGYTPLRENAMVEWREAARHMNGSAERLIATIEQSFPPAGDIAKRFGFETRLFQIAAPDSIRLEVATSVYPTLDPGELPSRPPSIGIATEVPPATLRGLADIAGCASTDSTRQILNGVLFRPEDGGRLIATDGKRLGCSPATVPAQSFVLPVAACHILGHPTGRFCVIMPMRVTIPETCDIGQAGPTESDQRSAPKPSR